MKTIIEVYYKLLLISLVVLFSFGCRDSENQFSIYTIGDSTMANKSKEVYPETGWCQVLQQYFDTSVVIKNHALNGRSSKSFIDEGHWQEVFDSIQPGDFVFIQFGHNDEKDYDSTRYTLPFGTYSEYLEKFILETREKGANPVLLTSIVRRKFGDDGKLIDTHGEYPDATRQIAKNLNVPLIDLQKLSEEWINSLGDEPSKEMYLWTPPDGKYPEGRKDDTHLSEMGAQQLAILALQECKRKSLSFMKHSKMK